MGDGVVRGVAAAIVTGLLISGCASAETPESAPETDAESPYSVDEFLASDPRFAEEPLDFDAFEAFCHRTGDLFRDTGQLESESTIRADTCGIGMLVIDDIRFSLEVGYQTPKDIDAILEEALQHGPEPTDCDIDAILTGEPDDLTVDESSGLTYRFNGSSNSPGAALYRFGQRYGVTLTSMMFPEGDEAIGVHKSILQETLPTVYEGFPS